MKNETYKLKGNLIVLSKVCGITDITLSITEFFKPKLSFCIKFENSELIISEKLYSKYHDGYKEKNEKLASDFKNLYDSFIFTFENYYK